MKRAIKAWLLISAETALAVTWLFYGIEGAGNVFTVFAVGAAILGVVAGLSENMQRDMAEKGHTFGHNVRFFVRTGIAASCVWYGHTWTGVFYMVGNVFAATAMSIGMDAKRKAEAK